MFIGMWNFCDDYGVMPARIGTLKMQIFPADDITKAQISAMIEELKAQGLIVEYEINGDRFWFVTGWDKHQRPDTKTGLYPRPDGKIGEKIRRTFGERSPNDRRNDEQKEKEKEKEKEKDINLKKEKNARGADFENENSSSELDTPDVEQDYKKSPPSSAPPPAPEHDEQSNLDRITGWVRKRKAMVFGKAREAGLINDEMGPEVKAKVVKDALEDFNAFYTGREDYEANPCHVFSECYGAWFRRRGERGSTAKKNGKSVSRKKEDTVSFTPEQCAQIFRARHGFLADSYTQNHANKLAQCTTKDQFEDLLEKQYESLKQQANSNARRGPLDLAAAIGSAMPN